MVIGQRFRRPPPAVLLAMAGLAQGVVTRGRRATPSSVAGPAAWKDADAADDDAEEAEEADEAEEAGANEAGVLISGTTSGCRGAE